MARIRTIKPDFWESESIGRLSMGARLLCIACLNMADDEGLLRWNEAYLMSQAFIYDDLNIEQISEWMHELVREKIIFPYKAGSTNQKLAWIINFRNHQVINRPQPSKLPPPSIQNSDYKTVIYSRDKHICHLCGEAVNINEQNNIVGSKAPSLDHLKPVSVGGNDYPSNLKLAHLSCNKSRKNKPMPNDDVNDSVNDSLTEGKGKEGKGREETYSSQQAGNELDIPADSDEPDSQNISPCPHQEIINLYAKHLPMGIQPKVWTDARQTSLRTRWREDIKRQSLEWWDRFFAHIAKSDFLTGKVSNRDGRAFEISLDWIITASNFVKIIEGKYDNKVTS